MPVPLDIRTRWIEERLVDDFGRQIVVRPWLLEHVFKPLDGYQTWRVGPDLCDPCKERVGKLRASRKACFQERHHGCAGTVGHKIVITVLSMPRQEGKTTGFAAYSLADLFLARNTQALYLAAAEDQAARIFEQKWVSPIERQKGLKTKVIIHTNEIHNEKKNNSFRFVPTSSRSVPGGSYRRLYIDEARDVPEETAIKLIPSILSAYGLECPHGHYTSAAGAEAPFEFCPSCSSPLEEWFGEVVIASSAGEEAGWFYELVQQLTGDPDPGAWLFHTTQRLNPHKSLEAEQVLDRTLGKLPSMKGLVNRELHNVFSRRGTEFLPAEAVDAITDKALVNLDISDRPTVGFIDCSKTTDLTSLVLGSDLTGTDFKKLTVTHIKVWDPAHSRGRVRYQDIRSYLHDMFGGWLDLDRKGKDAPQPLRWSALLELHIDVSLLSDAQDLFDWCRKQPWGGRVQAYQGGDSLATKLLWDALEQRALSGPQVVAIPDHPQLKHELRNAAIKVDHRNIAKVVDHSEGNRIGRHHRDISMSLAGVCWVASRYVVRGQARATEAAMKHNKAVNPILRPLTSDMNHRNF